MLSFENNSASTQDEDEESCKHQDEDEENKDEGQRGSFPQNSEIQTASRNLKEGKKKEERRGSGGYLALLCWRERAESMHIEEKGMEGTTVRDIVPTGRDGKRGRGKWDGKKSA